MSGRPEQLHTIAEVAKLWRVSDDTVYRLLASGELRSVRVGSRRRIPESALNEYVARTDGPKVVSLRR